MEKDKKKAWLGADTLPTVWIYICVIFNLIGILAAIMLIIAELVILSVNFTHYVDQYEHKYRSFPFVI